MEQDNSEKDISEKNKSEKEHRFLLDWTNLKKDNSEEGGPPKIKQLWKGNNWIRTALDRAKLGKDYFE